MKILWLINLPLPEVCNIMHEKPLPFGGWLVNSSVILAKEDDIFLSVAFPKQGVKDVTCYYGEKITYYAFTPLKNVETGINEQLSGILRMENPDIVHIYGTEFPHTLSMIMAAEKLDYKAVISIQGLVSICAKHYLAHIPEKIQNRYTLRDLLARNNLKHQQKKFIARGKNEIEALKKAKHVIGRTDWDRACTMLINPNLQYHFCNETLREEFYRHEWTLEKCEKHSIFMSQASYPIKGLHYMLEAMPYILKRFPDAKLYIAGHNMTKTDLLKDRLRKSSYDKYIIELIKKSGLKDNITFTGVLDEKQMCERYLKSNVFVCSSSIENSPNSLGEAMLLGLPCVASNVGGVPDLLRHKKEGFLYPADESYMLAHYVCMIFDNSRIALGFSKNARKHAMATHDPVKNVNTLIEIYKEILNREN